MLSAATSPATIAAPLEPSPAAKGTSDSMRKERRSTGWRSANDLTQRFESSAGTACPPTSTENSPVSSTSSSRNRETAPARESNPGPRFAEEAGTRILQRRPISAVRGSFQHGAFHRLELRLAGDHRSGVLDRDVRVLEPVARDDADQSLRLRAVLQRARDRRGRSGLAEDPLVRREPALRLEDLLVGDRVDPPARLPEGFDRLLPSGRVADADRRCDRLRPLDRMSHDDRGGAGCLKAEDPRPAATVFFEAPPPGGHVARVANWNGDRVGRRTKVVTDLERRRLLPLDAKRIDRVDELDWM